MRTRKILAGILALALAFSIMGISVSAATGYSLYIGELEFTSTKLTMTSNDTASGIKSGKATYDPNTNTLTLDNVTISDKAFEYSMSDETGKFEGVKAVIAYLGEKQKTPLKIELKGTNTVKGSDGGEYIVYNNVIRVEYGPVEIIGDGSSKLIANGFAANTKYGISYGIYGYSKVSIKNCIVEATGGENPFYICSACGKSTEKWALTCPHCGKLSTVQARTPFGSLGIYSGNGLEIVNSSVNATGGMVGGNTLNFSTMSYGIFNEGSNIQITDSNVTTLSGEAYMDYSMYSSGKVVFDGSIVNAKSGANNTLSIGIYADGTIDIKNGSKVNVLSGVGKTGIAESTSCAIKTAGNLEVTDSVLSAVAPTATYSMGALVGDVEDGETNLSKIKIKDSEVTIAGESLSTNLVPITRNFTKDYYVEVDINSNGKASTEYNGEDNILGFKFYHVNSGHFCYVEKVGLTDVPKNEWYHEYVDFVVSKGIMNGTGNSRFEPNANVTRAMFAQLLYNMEGKPAPTSSNVFTDVPENEWYRNAIVWAYENKLVNGYGDGKFGPEDCITRQQMAALLYRYAQFKGDDTSASADLSSYADVVLIDDYAVAAIRWAVARGLINGTSATTISPSDFAERCQIAAIITRYEK